MTENQDATTIYKIITRDIKIIRNSKSCFPKNTKHVHRHLGCIKSF